MSKLLLNKSFTEHHNYPKGENIANENVEKIPFQILFCNKKDAICVDIKENRTLHTSYYIGVDWIDSNNIIYVEPKINNEVSQTNYLEMLFTALKNPEIADYTNELFEIKWEEKQIEITQQQDILTPLLVIQYLLIVKEIVRKGLKKSYYNVEQNLYGKVKGKVLVGQTIKKNLLKNKNLNTYCTFQEFGINGLENRLLKKALIFVQRYLPTYKNLNSKEFSSDILNYIMPAFETVSEEVDLNEIKHSKVNVFYKEYAEGIRLAKLILKRFGYNISNTIETSIQTPPFWIDMSKLFELYVLGLLKDQFGEEVIYQYQANYGQPDYLLVKQKAIVDAKYKPYYTEDFTNQIQWKRDVIAADIRQLCGYSRDKKVLSKLGIFNNEEKIYLPECIIVYPNFGDGINNNINLDLKRPIEEYVNFYKIPVNLPTLQKL